MVCVVELLRTEQRREKRYFSVHALNSSARRIMLTWIKWLVLWQEGIFQVVLFYFHAAYSQLYQKRKSLSPCEHIPDVYTYYLHPSLCFLLISWQPCAKHWKVPTKTDLYVMPVDTELHSRHIHSDASCVWVMSQFPPQQWEIQKTEPGPGRGCCTCKDLSMCVSVLVYPAQNKRPCDLFHLTAN